MKQQGIVVALIVSMGVLTACAIDLAPWSAKENQPDSVQEAGDTVGTSMEKAAEDADNPGDAVEATGDGGFKDSNDTSDSGDAGADSSITAEWEGNGVLPPFGNFDRTDPDFDLFDPCTEIPEEKLKEAGLEDNGERRLIFSDMSTCSFFGQSSSGNPAMISIASSTKSYTDVEIPLGKREIYRGNELPVVAFEDEFEGDLICTVNINTVRGMISVGFGNTKLQEDNRENCRQAELVLKKLID
ncbi:hypothetical protein AWU68_0580 [Corynebacterium simulans]|uniref:DUF3558 family protein n=2 Tax=Corynebacterium simulans TaxID=146827 RepID=UPI000785D13A|nr:DUF3558 family protein [Corynebacterium simulans]AMO90880.1 hypothetical protein AWU68_0580 [Corynebacterium simulans]